MWKRLTVTPRSYENSHTVMTATWVSPAQVEEGTCPVLDTLVYLLVSVRVHKWPVLKSQKQHSQRGSCPDKSLTGVSQKPVRQGCSTQCYRWGNSGSDQWNILLEAKKWMPWDLNAPKATSLPLSYTTSNSQGGTKNCLTPSGVNAGLTITCCFSRQWGWTL